MLVRIRYGDDGDPGIMLDLPALPLPRDVVIRDHKACEVRWREFREGEVIVVVETPPSYATDDR